MNTSISDQDFNYVSEFTSRNSAIVITEAKRYLVETRLEPLARKIGLDSLSDLIRALRAQSPFSDLHAEAIDALTTNETYFFRDFHPFEALQKTIIPNLIEQKRSTRSLSIWSAACSTGQEPYSLAMMLSEHFPILKNWKVSILATDLSSTALNRAKEGRYNQIEVNRGLPANLLIKYFKMVDKDWVIDDKLRDWIEFRPMNLIQPWRLYQLFDIVLIRNVLIYFDVETKKTILNKLNKCIRPGGYLFLGASESVTNLDNHWELGAINETIAYRKTTPYAVDRSIVAGPN